MLDDTCDFIEQHDDDDDVDVESSEDFFVSEDARPLRRLGTSEGRDVAKASGDWGRFGPCAKAALMDSIESAEVLFGV